MKGKSSMKRKQFARRARAVKKRLRRLLRLRGLHCGLAGWFGIPHKARKFAGWSGIPFKGRKFAGWSRIPFKGRKFAGWSGIPFKGRKFAGWFGIPHKARKFAGWEGRFTPALIRYS